MNNLNRKKIGITISIVFTLAIIISTFVHTNTVKAAKMTIDDVTWYFDINEDNEVVNLYTPDDVATSTITIPTEVTYKNVTYPVVSVGTATNISQSGLFKGSLEPNTTVSFAQKDGKTSITKINAYAFCGCTNIQSVNIPDSVTEIGDYAFYNCESLTTVNGVENIETLGNYVFKDSKFLKYITLDKTTTFGTGLFDGCNSLYLTITNPNMDLSNQNFVPAKLIGFKNSTTNDYYTEKCKNSSYWGILDGTTKTDGTTYPKSFKVMVKTDTDVTVASGLFKDYFYGLTGKEVSDLTECATKPYYTLDGYYLGTDDNAECYYTYDKTNNKMITKKSTFSADYADDIMELTPKFTPKSYDIVYSLNGGQWKKGVSADLENTNKEQYVYSVGKVLNTNIEKRGYLFTGWYADINNPVVLTTKVTDTEHGLKSFLAKWSPIHYDIKFDKNTADAGSMAGQNIAYDTTTALTKNGYTKKGYSFNGWNTKADGSGTKYADEADVTNLSYTDGDTITLYAQWSANPYKLTFDANKGSCSEASRMVKYNSTYGVLPTATRIGYTFDGWYTLENNGVKVTKDTVMQSVYGETVHAHWNANSYNIRFDGNKASSGSMDAEYILYDETKPLAANAYKKTGYTFTGWNTKADGSGKTYHDEDNVLNLATNGVITLYAQWSANHYSVVFDRNHATGGVVGAVSMIYDQSRQLPANGFTRTGYQFDGWNTKADGSGTTYSNTQLQAATISSNTDYYAMWTPENPDNAVTLTFSPTGCDAQVTPASMTVVRGDTIYAYQMPTPTKTSATGDAYTFNGWYGAASESDTTDKAPFTLTDNKTVYAHWTYAGRDQVTVTFDYDGATSPTVPTTITVGKGDSIGDAMPTTPVKTNYSFDKWVNTADSSDFDKTTTVNSDITVKATYKSDITVNFNINDGTTPATPFATDKGAPSKYYTAPSAPTRANYTFVGWNTKANGSGKFITAADYATLNDVSTAAGGTNPVELYAYWADAPVTPGKLPGNETPNDNGVKVTFDSNASGSASSTVTDANPKYVYPHLGDALGTLMPEAPTRTHYKFVGWNTKADGSGTTFTDATTVTFKELSNQEIEDYLDTNEWQGKAGAYAIQGVASKFVEKIDGDLENVIGMPMYKVIKYLEA